MGTPVEFCVIKPGSQRRRKECDPSVEIFFKNIKDGNIEAVKDAILSGQVSVDEYNDNGFTAIHEAACCGHCLIVELLVHLGSKTIDTPCFGYTPLRSAVMFGHNSTVETLVRLGSKAIDMQGNFSRTPMHSAVDRGPTSVITLLRLGSKSIDAVCVNNETPLSSSICDKDTAKTLILLGADYSKHRDQYRIKCVLMELQRDGWEELAYETRYAVYFEQSLTDRLLSSCRPFDLDDIIPKQIPDELD